MDDKAHYTPISEENQQEGTRPVEVNPYANYQQQNPYPQQMTPEQQTQIQLFKDSENLNLLSVFHFVLAGLNSLGLLFVFVHYYFMSRVFSMVEDTAATMPSSASAPAMPTGAMDEAMQMMMIGYTVIGILILAAVIANIVAGRMLRKRKGRVFCMVIGALNCLNFPFGTVLGVFTFIVLCRNSVVQLYHNVGMQKTQY